MLAESWWLMFGLDTRPAVRGLSQWTGSAHVAGKATEHFERTTKNLTGALSVLGGALTVQQLVKYADTWTLINARIKLVTESTEQSMAVQYRLYETAQKTRNTLAATAVLYTRVALNADQLGRSHEELLTVVESVNAAMLLSGATGVESAQAMRQFAQALGSGRVQGDEFRTMMEAMPLVARAVSDEMGVAMGDLYRLSAQGMIDVQTVIDALIKKNEELMRLTEDMPWTMEHVILEVTNAMTFAVGAFNHAFQVTTKVGQAFLWVANNVSHLLGVFSGLIASAIAYRVAMFSMAYAIKIAAYANALLTTTAARARLQLALMSAFGGLQAWWQLAKQIRNVADVTAMLAMVAQSAVKALATIAAFGAGVAAYLWMQKKIEDATKEWEEAQGDLNKALGEAADRYVEGLTEKYRDLWKELRKAHQEAILVSNDLDMFQGAFGGISTGLDPEVLKLQFELLEKLIEIESEFGKNPEHAAGLSKIAVQWYEARLQVLEYERSLERIKDQLEEQYNIVENFVENVQREFANIFEDFFSSGIESFADFFDTIKKMFFRMLAEMVSARMMMKLREPMESMLGNIFASDMRKQYLDEAARLSKDVLSRHGDPAIRTGAPGGQNFLEKYLKEKAVVTDKPEPPFEGLKVFGDKDLWTKVGRYIAPGIAAGMTGLMAGNFASGPVGSGFVGAVSGAGVGAGLAQSLGLSAMTGGLVGAGVGLIGGLISAFNKHKAELERHRMIIAANSKRLEDLRRSLEGRNWDRFNSGMRILASFLNGGVAERRTGNIMENQRSYFEEFFTLARLAEEFGIQLDGSKEAYEQLAEAVRLTIKQLTTFTMTLDDQSRRIEAYNKIFDVEDTPMQALRDTYSLLGTLAPELMAALNLENLDLNTDAGRTALAEGLKEIFNMIDQGLLNEMPQLLGAFNDKGQLLDAILRTKDAMNKLANEVFNVVTDFPRAMDLMYYQLKFGTFGTGNPYLSDQEKQPRVPGTEFMPSTVTSSSYTWNVTGGITIISNGDETPDELLTKLETAVSTRRSRGGTFDLATEVAF